MKYDFEIQIGNATMKICILQCLILYYYLNKIHRTQINKRIRIFIEDFSSEKLTTQ